MSNNISVTIKRFRIRSIKAPLNKPHKTASGTIEAAPLVLSAHLTYLSIRLAEAIERMKALDEEKLGWIEEPVRAEDYVGHATVRAAIKTPVQTGENWWGFPDMSKSIAAGASDLIMPDAMKIGGVSGWIKAATLAQENNLPVSSHLFAEISSHLMAATPGAHMLEWLDVASAINRTPLTIVEGQTTALDIPGSGLNWNEKAVAEFAT